MLDSNEMKETYERLYPKKLKISIYIRVQLKTLSLS